MVRQDRCGMKVSTVACLFGAWTREKMMGDHHCYQVLDVGAGTGLLSMMLAQDTCHTIHALEIDPDAAVQCKSNFLASPFSNRLNVQAMDATHYNAPMRYDWIICNPPFFDKDLPSPNLNRHTARHQSTLTYSALALKSQAWIDAKGSCSLLMPHSQVASVIAEFRAAGWFDYARLHIQDTPIARPSCTAISFKRETSGLNSEETIVIRSEHGQYADRFVALLQPFYLYL